MAERQPADSWYAGLPGVVVAAGALITDPAGSVLVVKPNYREHWTIPGGICEFGEPPQAGCAREVAEEIGLPLRIGGLLAIDWSQPFGADVRPIMHFLFDGGEIDKSARIVVQEAELDGYQFTPVADLADYLPSFVLRRVAAALHSRQSGGTIYLPG